MNILIVEDMPELKIKHIIDYLKVKNIDFSYTTTRSSSSALRYLFTHLSEIDLIVLDLGLPFYDNGSEYEDLGGLFLLEELLRKNIKISLIVNSTTEIPNEKELFEKYQKHCGIIEHVPELKGDYLLEFIKNVKQ